MSFSGKMDGTASIFGSSMDVHITQKKPVSQK
jgi:hypothetical protein